MTRVSYRVALSACVMDVTEEWSAGPFEMEGFDTTIAHPSRTGLPMIVGVLCDCSRVPRTPHMLVSQHHGDEFRRHLTFHVTLERYPRITGNPGFATLENIQAIKRFVKRNLEPLLTHWKLHTGSHSMLLQLRPTES